jgi:hypothetical protein
MHPYRMQKTLTLPLLPSETSVTGCNYQSISALIVESFNLRRKSGWLLEEAKEMVEREISD